MICKHIFIHSDIDILNKTEHFFHFLTFMLVFLQVHEKDLIK